MADIYYLNEDWKIQPRLNRISNADASHTIPPKYMEVLLFLMQNEREVISRDELLSAVWKDAVVVEESLTRAVSELRKILRDDPKTPRIIETIPKKGYRLIANVRHDPQHSAHDKTDAQTEKRFQWKSLYRVLSLIALFVIAAVLIIRSRIFTSSSQPPIHLMPLTSYPGDESNPALSPDGNRLAFRWNGEDGYSSSIYVKVIGSERPLRLTGDDFTTEPAWSPDGRLISYVKFTPSGGEVFSIPSLGGPETRLVEKITGIRNPVWSPDGGELLFTLYCQEISSWLVFRYPLDTRDTVRVTNPVSGPVQDSKPIYSPNGKRIAFIRMFQGVMDIFTTSVQGGPLQQVTNGGQWITDVDWSPDGHWIIYTSKDGVWKIPAAGGRAVLLAAGGPGINNLTVARKNWLLAYEQSNREENIWRLILPQDTLVAATPRRFISSSRVDRESIFSPDGHQIAFISSRSGDPQLWLCRRDGSNPVQLTHFNGCEVRYPDWSPDSRRITFSADLYGNFDIFSVDVEGGEPIQLTRDITRDILSSWSPDGEWIYFNSRRDRRWQIWKIPASGGKSQLIWNEPGIRPTVSRDNTTIYYEKVTQNGQGIWQHPLGGGREHRLFFIEDNFIQNWLVTEEGIYYGSRGVDRTYTIGFYNFRSGDLSVLYRSSETAYDFTLDPETRITLFSKIERDEGDIVLMENFE